MELYRFTSTTTIELANGSYAPAGLVVEFPCYGPNDMDVDKKLRDGLRSRYNIETRSDYIKCYFKHEKL